MAIEKPSQLKHSIEATQDGVKISIPLPKNGPLLTLMGFALAFIAFQFIDTIFTFSTDLFLLSSFK